MHQCQYPCREETVTLKNALYIVIHHNDIYNIRDDGITLGLGSVDIYNNIIRDRISPIEGHPDAVQTWGRYYRIYNN